MEEVIQKITEKFGKMGIEFKKTSAMRFPAKPKLEIFFLSGQTLPADMSF